MRIAQDTREHGPHTLPPAPNPHRLLLGWRVFQRVSVCEAGSGFPGAHVRVLEEGCVSFMSLLKRARNDACRSARLSPCGVPEEECDVEGGPGEQFQARIVGVQGSITSPMGRVGVSSGRFCFARRIEGHLHRKPEEFPWSEPTTDWCS